MSEYKVSPGPWSIEHTVDDEGDNIWWVNTQYFEPAVAKCFNPAYAQIISAIPDMYEALEECLTLFALGVNAVSNKRNDHDVKRAKVREIEKKVINALAKARGESHD